MNPISPTVRAGLAALVLAVFVPTVHAQALPDQPTEAGRAPLSSSEVSDAEVESAAEIVVSLQRQEAELEKKYGETEDMTKQRRRQVQEETMRERQLLLQKKTLEEDLDAGRLELIMISAKRDSALHRRVRAAIKKKKRENSQKRVDATTDETGDGRR